MGAFAATARIQIQHAVRNLPPEQQSDYLRRFDEKNESNVAPSDGAGMQQDKREGNFLSEKRVGVLSGAVLVILGLLALWFVTRG